MPQIILDGMEPKRVDDRPGKVIAVVTLNDVTGGEHELEFMAEYQPAIGTQMWIGGMIELICGVMIVIGLQTRWAAFLASGTMAVAYIQFHWSFQFGPEFFPAINGGDAAILYSLVFLHIACRGAGKWSLDKNE